jgi:hypothetical protein
LQWTQIDLVRRLAWIHPVQAKARKAIAVPLNPEAVIIRQQTVKPDARVQTPDPWFEIAQMIL